MDFMHPYTGHNLNKKDDLQEISPDFLSDKKLRRKEACTWISGKKEPLAALFYEHKPVSMILFLARDYKVCFNNSRYIISLAKN